MIKFRFFKKGKNELATADTKRNPRKTLLLLKRKNSLWKQ